MIPHIFHIFTSGGKTTKEISKCCVLHLLYQLSVKGSSVYLSCEVHFFYWTNRCQTADSFHNNNIEMLNYMNHFDSAWSGNPEPVCLAAAGVKMLKIRQKFLLLLTNIKFQSHIKSKYSSGVWSWLELHFRCHKISNNPKIISQDF